MNNVYLNNDQNYYNNFENYDSFQNSYNITTTNNNADLYENTAYLANTGAQESSGVSWLNSLFSSLSGFFTSGMSALTTNGSKFLGRIGLPVGVALDVARDWDSIKSGYQEDISNRNYLFPNTIRASVVPVGSAVAGGLGSFGGGFLCGGLGSIIASPVAGLGAGIGCGAAMGEYGYDKAHDYLSNIDWN